MVKPYLDTFLELVKEEVIKIDEFNEELSNYCETLGNDGNMIHDDTKSKPCEACVFFTTFLQNEIGNDLSEENIRHYINGACDQFDIGKEDCERIITENADTLIRLIQKQESPASICTLDLDFCDIDFWDSDDIETNGLKCSTCTFIINFIYNKIGSDNNLKKIESVLSIVCNKIPFGKNLCKTIISKSLPALKNYLVKKFPPSLICSKIKLCPTTYAESIQELASILFVKEYMEENPVSQIENFSSGCELCQWIKSTFGSWIDSGYDAHEIVMFSNQICRYTGQYKEQCEEIMKDYIPRIIESMENDSNYDICSVIGKCTA